MPKPATTRGGARRLSDLLQEQQEPFLQVQDPRRRYSVAEACGRRLQKLRDRRGGAAGGSTPTASGRSLLCLCGTKALSCCWGGGGLAGCFSSCAAPRQRFRRLPRAGGVADCCDGALDCRTRLLSPVSVLELHSDEESPVPSREMQLNSFIRGDERDAAAAKAAKPSPASGPSPPPTKSNHGLPRAHATPCSTFSITNAKIPIMEVEDSGNKVQRKRGEYCLLEKEQAVVSAWERITADISRIPTLVALDLSGSASVRDDWRRRAGEEEARHVGQSIEAMIFEEVRWEAVRDMIGLPPH